MPRRPIPTWYYTLVVVRKEQRFLVVQENGHGQLWYLPAGRVEPGETLVDAAIRETLEESGIEVVPEGIISVQHTPYSDGSARMRMIFLARPVDDRPPKTTVDEHSLQAAWVTLEEVRQLPLRGEEVYEIFQAMAGGRVIAPLSLLGSEDEPFC